jgi:hypothetical protein
MEPLGRNRSEGWRHAKLDGHANEKQFAESLSRNKEFLAIIENNVIKNPPNGTMEISVDGAKHVESIFGDKTTSKVDLAINWSSGEQINISLKKSNSGQVWLISAPRFISAVEFHLNRKLDSEVKIGISLFIGGSNLTNYEDYFNKCLDLDKKNNPTIAEQELHQTRLVGKSIESTFPSVWESTLDFFNTNIALITRLSFAQGLAKSEKDAAEVIIYNKAAEGKSVFPIARIIKNAALRTKSHPVIAGPKNGGSTLQLPTGFLQMHHPQGENLLQFHHQYKKISLL